MKTVFALITAAVFALTLAPKPSAEPEIIHAWLSLSANPDGTGSQLPLFTGTRTIYLWWNDPLSYIASSFEFSISGDFEVTGIRPQQGMVNLGSVTSPILTLESDDCLGGETVLLAEIDILDSTGGGGEVCLTESETSARLCFQHCETLEWFSPFAEGISTSGENCGSGNTPSGGCNVTPVDWPTWGMIKSFFH